MKPVIKRYGGEDDYSRIRQFLRDVMLANSLREHSWHVARMDYWRWHGIMNQGEGPLEEKVFMWEKDGDIVSVLNAEGKCHAFVQMHPEYHDTELYGEMLAVAERQLADIGREGRRKVIIWADSEDVTAHKVLTHRGYGKIERPEVNEHQRRQDLGREIPEPKVADGYNIRNIIDIEDLPSRSWCSWKAFHPDEPDEKYEGWLWYRNIQAAPLYRQDLDIVATTLDGEIVSFCTIWYDEATRTAYYEPVGTHPAHQKKGLGKACMTEGLHRLKKIGCQRAFVGGYSVAANGLYNSAGFGEFDLSEPWQRFLD